VQRKLFALWLAGQAALAAMAGEKIPLLKVGADYYTNVAVISITATDFYFTHSRGMSNAKMKNLDPETQKRFGFDATKAAEGEKKQADANRAYRMELAGKPAAPVRRDVPPARRATTDNVIGADIPVTEIHAISFRGRLAPQFVVEKWLGAKPDTKGKFVLISFWATWVAPCLRSIPELNKLQAKFKDQLVIIGLTDESEEEVRALKSPAIDYFVGIDTAASMKSAVGVRGLPHAMLLDPSGVVRFEGHPGYLNDRNLAGLLAKYAR
jgi:thiol-disulfide isomerase/thioredoxin